MALCDYHLCAVCGGKAFYDASCSNDSYLDMVERGAVKALCYTCEQTHKIVVVSLSALKGGAA